MKNHPQVLQKNTAQEVQGNYSPLYCAMVNKWRHHFYRVINHVHATCGSNSTPVEFEPLEKYFDGFTPMYLSIQEASQIIVETLVCKDGVVEGWNFIDTENSSILIFFDPSVAVVRQRFTIAHEWAHVAQSLDGQFKADMETIEDDNERRAVIESVANYFAAYYLSPSYLLYLETQRELSTIPQYLEQVSALARKFNISKPAMTNRIKTAPLPNKQ